MPETDLINIKGEKTGSFQLDEKVFDAGVNPSLVHEVLIAQLAARRQGSANTKTRGEVSGGGVKPWRQKGTGRARVGSTRSPLWRHGGTTFGPKPRSFEMALPKKKRKIALKYILTSKLREGKLKIVDVLELKEPKTRLAVQFLKDIKAAGHKTLVVVKEENVNLDRAFSNIADVKLILARNLNIHDLINYEITLMTQDAANALKEVAQ